MDARSSALQAIDGVQATVDSATVTVVGANLVSASVVSHDGTPSMDRNLHLRSCIMLIGVSLDPTLLEGATSDAAARREPTGATGMGSCFVVLLAASLAT